MWRGKCTDGIHRRKTRYAACQTAKNGRKRTVGETDRPQQRRNVCQRTEDHSAGSRLVSYRSEQPEALEPRHSP